MVGSVALVVSIVLTTISVSQAKYRHFHVENHDVCTEQSSFIGSATPTRKLSIGSGAAIFTLQSPSSQFQPNYGSNKPKRCKIHIQAPDDDHGLMIYVEEMHMRKSKKDGVCIDFIQFGQEDIIPFLTLSKSQKYCGEVFGKEDFHRGISYDDQYGNLLIWISLGGRRQTAFWPSISDVNLTLIVTTYKKNCERPDDIQYRRCGDRSHCIWSHYVCDGHFNCAKDKYPLDEEDCPTHSDESTPDSIADDSYLQSESPRLNQLSLILIIVCVTLVLVMLLVTALRYRLQKRCCSSSSHAEGPDRASRSVRSLDELTEMRQHRPRTEENLYLPLASSYSRREDPGPSIAVTELSGPIPEEPPPSYNELFPETQETTVQSRN